MWNVTVPLCSEEGCRSTSRSFGFPGERGTRCKKHALPGMRNVVNRLCEHSGCSSTSRVFDVPGGKGRFCKEHALSTMVNVVSVRCEFEGCITTSRNFDVPGGKGRFCKEHAELGMIDVRNVLCQQEGCSFRANYSMKGTPAMYCSKHKMIGMCSRQSCLYGDCKVIAGYNYPGETLGKYCATHKLDGMVNLRMRMCQFAGCKKCASFGTTTPRFCKTHAHEGMRNLLLVMCSYPGCDIAASYNHPGKRPILCQTHSEEGMVIVIGRGCEHSECTSKSRYYDFPGGKGRYCTRHKEPGMVDVSNPICEMCSSLASYGIPGNKKSRCSRHRTPGMITRPKAKCITCRKPAFYGKSFVPRHCELHKEEDEDNLIERECLNCHLVMVLDKDGKCECCVPGRFESNRLAKQNALMEYLNRRGLKGDSTDIVIERGACGRERPDRTFDFGDKIVILECDENQHQNYESECERVRMINISQSYGGIPVYFIRWNPDHYTPGIPENITRRHKRVADMLVEIRDGVMELPEAFLCVTYLYYNGWSGIPSWETILELSH